MALESQIGTLVDGQLLGKMQPTFKPVAFKLELN